RHTRFSRDWSSDVCSSDLQQVRVLRQVKQHQVMGELEVAALAANLGTDQRLGALLGVGKVGGSPVPLQQAQVLMEGSTADTGAQIGRASCRERVRSVVIAH